PCRFVPWAGCGKKCTGPVISQGPGTTTASRPSGTCSPCTATLDFIRNSNTLGFKPPLALLDSEVVQPTSRFHDRIRIPLFTISEDVFHDAAAFHPGEGMLHFDPDTCQPPVRALFRRREFALARLFFSPGKSP